MTETTPPTIGRDEIIALLKEHIYVDATGLAPAIVGHYLFGFDKAADALIARLGANTELAQIISAASQDFEQSAKAITDRLAVTGELVEVLQTAQRYILHVGANETEAGRRHPQQLLCDQMDAVLARAGTLPSA